MPHALAGLYPAFLTPLDAGFRLNESVAVAMLHALLATGMDGVYVAGSTGEGMRLPIALRERLVEVVSGAMPRGKHLLVHVGAPEPGDAFRLAEHAASTGASAVSSLPPAGESAAGVFRYYQELAERSPLPVILYYFPKIAPEAFTDPQQLLDVCDLPNVIGIKFTDFNTHLMQRLVKRGKLVFSGYDEALAAGLLMGAQGGIGSTYNAMPETYLRLYRSAQAGEWAEAAAIQWTVNDAIDELIRHPFFPALRAVVRARGFDCGPLMSGDTIGSAESEAMLGTLAGVDGDPCGLRLATHLANA